MAGGREGGIGGLVGGIFMRGNKSFFLRQSTLYSLFQHHVQYLTG